MLPKGDLDVPFLDENKNLSYFAGKFDDLVGGKADEEIHIREVGFYGNGTEKPVSDDYAHPPHYGTKPGHFETSKIHFPTSKGVSKVSERANE